MVISAEPFNAGLFRPLQRFITYKVASIGGSKQDSFKVAKVTDAFSNLFHFAKSAHKQNIFEFTYKINLTYALLPIYA